MITIARQRGIKLTTLKAVIYGGAPCPVPLALEMKEVLNVERIIVRANLSPSKNRLTLEAE
jgi:hypothetical protein